MQNLAATTDAKQVPMDMYLQEHPLKSFHIQMTSFQKACPEWLIATDQVTTLIFHFIWLTLPFYQLIKALEHPTFKNMINVTAHATNGVKIPDCHATQKEIIDTFQSNLMHLCSHLNVVYSVFHCPTAQNFLFRVQLWWAKSA